MNYYKIMLITLISLATIVLRSESATHRAMFESESVPCPPGYPIYDREHHGCCPEDAPIFNPVGPGCCPTSHPHWDPINKGCCAIKSPIFNPKDRICCPNDYPYYDSNQKLCVKLDLDKIRRLIAHLSDES